MFKFLNQQSAPSLFTKILFIIFLGTLIYSNSFNVPFQFDGRKEIENYQPIIDFDPHHLFEFRQSRFVAYLTLALNHELHQGNVFGYHLFNLSVHILSAILVLVLTSITFSSSSMRSQSITRLGPLLSFIAALIFLSHPIQTQAVTYIIQRIESLASLFYISSLTTYAYAFIKVSPQKKGQRIILISISFLSGLLAIFTKEIAFTLPFTIFMYHHYFIHPIINQLLKRWYVVIPGFITLFFIGTILHPAEEILSNKITPLVEIATPYTYLLTQFRVLITYIRLLFLPVNQSLMYYYPLSQSLFEPQVIFSLIFHGILISLAFKLYQSHKLISFGIFWFYSTLLVTSSIIPINDVIFEHRLYLPTLGFSLIIIELLWILFQKKSHLFVFLSIFIIGAFSILTYNRNQTWQSEFGMWLDIAQKAPQIPKVHNNLGTHYVNQQNIPAAINSFETAIELEPRYASPMFNLGYIYYQNDQLELARVWLERAASLTERPNRAAKTLATLGVVYLELGETDLAIQAFQATLQIEPTNPIAREQLTTLSIPNE